MNNELAEVPEASVSESWFKEHRISPLFGFFKLDKDFFVSNLQCCNLKNSRPCFCSQPMNSRAVYVNDEKIKSFILPSLPDFLELEFKIVENSHHYSIITQEPLKKYTILGTISGNILNYFESKALPIKYFTLWESLCNDKSLFFLDDQCKKYNWLLFIPKTKNQAKNNIDVCFDPSKNELVFFTNRAVQVNEKLHTFYQLEKGLKHLNELLFLSFSSKVSSEVLNSSEKSIKQSSMLEQKCCGGVSNEEYRCEECGKVLITLSYQTKGKKSIPETDYSNYKHVCEQSLEKFPGTKIEECYHKDEFKKKIPRRCIMCNASCLKSPNQTKTKKSEGDKKPCDCFICDWITKDNSSLNKHVPVQTSQNVLKDSSWETCSSNSSNHNHQVKKLEELITEEIDKNSPNWIKTDKKNSDLSSNFFRTI